MFPVEWIESLSLSGCNFMYFIIIEYDFDRAPRMKHGTSFSWKNFCLFDHRRRRTSEIHIRKWNKIKSNSTWNGIFFLFLQINIKSVVFGGHRLYCFRNACWMYHFSAHTERSNRWWRQREEELEGGGRRKSRQEENIEDHFNIIGFCGLLFV